MNIEKLLEITKIINQIGATSSRNDKEKILMQHKNNQLLKDILYFIFNPYIVTGISEKKFNKFENMLIETTNINDVYELMDYLKLNNTGKDENIKEVFSFTYTNPYELHEFYKSLVTKSLKIGVTEKTLNKIYGKDFIPCFNVMLAEKYFECEEKVNGEFIVTQKLDGIRCVIVRENNTINIFSRQGQPIEDLVEIVEEAKLLPDNYVYDGELILRNNKNLPSKDLYRETVKVARKDGIKKNLIFNCFDVLDVEDFKEGISKVQCYIRKQNLHKFLLDLNIENKITHIVEVPILYKGTDKEQIIKLLDEAISKDQEGVMVNISNAPYSCKRTKDILKVKKFNDADVRVLHVLEGTGRNQNKLGAITIQFEHEGKLYECNCGSGFSDEERIKYWERPSLILNKIVTIGYFEISSNQQGGVGLRFPTWNGIVREDKNEISMY